jgi:hypothetical protein
MTGGLLKLNNLGAEDVILTGNPQMTFFKTIYKRHSNFSIESLSQTIEGSINFGNNLYITLNKTGDLIKSIVLEITLPELQPPNTNYIWYGYTNNIVCSLIKTITISIGGQLIDKHFGEWYDILDEYENNKNNHIYAKFNSEYSIRNNYSSKTLYLPLKFWFCKNTGNSLPVNALLHSDITLTIQLRELREIIKTDSSSWNLPQTNGNLDVKVWADYIFLDKDEKKLFSSNKHEYLIEQLQYTGEDTLFSGLLNYNFNLYFKHPIKEIIWIIIQDTNSSINSQTGNNILKYTSSFNNYSDTFKTAVIQINGQNLFQQRPSNYFRQVQPMQHHNYLPKKHIYSYSFALNPEDHQPSGTINFSSIDNAYLQMNFNQSGVGSSTNSKVKIFATNYNILRIMSGMASLAYQT